MVADPEQEVRSLAKKVLWILFAVVLVLALAVAGVTGYFWYQNNHIFVEDAVYPINAKTLDLRGQDISFEHYDAVHSQLPNCEIYWDVPFQVGKYPNDTTKLTVADLTEKDIRILVNYFPKLKTLDATACSDYAVLESAKQQLPGCEILYEVNLGGKSFAPEVTELTLEVGDYDYDTLMENLQYLPDVQQITLKKPELSLEQIDELKTTFGNITIDCTVDIGGTEYTMDTTELNLSGISSGDVAGVSEKLGMLSGLTSVELMKSDGTTGLTKEDVKTLKEAAPAASFHYVFDFYGETLSTTETTEVHIKNVNIGEEGLPEARLALDLMENCSRFVLENCKISNESMAPFHVARGDDGAYSVRHSTLGGDPFAGDPLRLVYRDGVAGGQDLPRGDLHVRQETYLQGALQVDSVQVLVRTAIAENTGPYDVVRPGLFSGRGGFAIRERKRFWIRGFFVSLSGRVRRSGSVQT